MTAMQGDELDPGSPPLLVPTWLNIRRHSQHLP